MREFHRPREAQSLAPVSLNEWRAGGGPDQSPLVGYPAATRAVVRMRMELEEDLPRSRRRERGSRGAINLIFNAVEAMPSGGTLTLRTRHSLAQRVRDELPDHRGRRYRGGHG